MNEHFPMERFPGFPDIPDSSLSGMDNVEEHLRPLTPEEPLEWQVGEVLKPEAIPLREYGLQYPGGLRGFGFVEFAPDDPLLDDRLRQGQEHAERIIGADLDLETGLNEIVESLPQEGEK